MKTLKRAVVGSFLALPLFAAGTSAVSAQTRTEEPIIMMWCVSCESRHVIELAPNKTGLRDLTAGARASSPRRSAGSVFSARTMMRVLANPFLNRRWRIPGWLRAFGVDEIEVRLA